HHFDRVARLELRRGPVGEDAALHWADAHLDLVRERQPAARTADGIAAPHRAAFYAGAQREELAGLEREGLAQPGWNREGDGDGAGRLGADARNGELMEAGDGHGAEHCGARCAVRLYGVSEA